jgi:hypothetical protein
MKGKGTPELSAIVVTRAGLKEIALTLDALARQTALDRMELVVVSPEPIPEDAPGLERFPAVRLITHRLDTLGHAIAEGMLAASAPVVGYAEEHSYPGPRWAEVLIERHQGPWSAVGWSVSNANPATTASWAHLLTDFGPGVAPVESGERHGPMPWHHVSYKRADLVPYGDRLPAMVEAEGLMQEDLLAQGKRLYMEGSVTSAHLNISKIRFNLRSHFLGGRSYGAARANHGGWGVARRALHTVGFPLVPLVRMRRLWPDVVRSRASRDPKRGLVASLVLYLYVDAFGEAVGCSLGSGPSREDRLPMELERERYLRSGDSGPPALVSPDAAS